MRKYQRYALGFPQWFSSSGHRLGLPHTSAFLLRCVAFCDDAHDMFFFRVTPVLNDLLIA